MIHDGVRLQDLVNKMIELLSENFYLRACCMLYDGFMLSLLSNPEERGEMLLRNVNQIPPDCMALYVHSHRCQKFNSDESFSLVLIFRPDDGGIALLPNGCKLLSHGVTF